MVDPLDEPGTNDPHAPHEPRPGEDFPADFFDDASDVSDLSDAPSDEPESEPFPPPPSSPTTDVHAGDPVTAGAEARPGVAPEAETLTPTETLRPSYPEDVPTPAAEEIKHHPVFPVVMGLALVGALAGAIAYNMKTSHENATPAPTAPATPATPEPVASSSEDLKKIQEDLAKLTTEVKDLQEKIGAMPRPEPAPDLKPLQAQVAELARTSESVAPLPKKFDGLDARVGAVDRSLGDLKTEISGLRDEVKKVGEQAAASKPAANTAAPAGASANTAALDEGIKLYKSGKYKDADAYFSKLTAADPEDARAWYFAALSHGFANNQWTGKPVELVQKGVEREKAGSPATPEVEAAVGDLTKSNGKDWLAFYRKGFAK